MEKYNCNKIFLIFILILFTSFPVYARRPSETENSNKKGECTYSWNNPDISSCGYGSGSLGACASDNNCIVQAMPGGKKDGEGDPCISSFTTSSTGCVNGKVTITYKDSCNGETTKTESCGPGDIPSNPQGEKACYRSSNGDGTFTYYFNYKKNSNDVKEPTLTETECDEKNICEEESYSNEGKATGICANKLTINDVKSGSNCTHEGNQFYNLECVESYVAAYTPELENDKITLKIASNGLINGLGYQINLKTIKSCTGSFNDVVFKDAYDNLTKRLNSATDSEGKMFYQNQIEKLKGYVKAYNEKYNSYNESLIENNDNSSNITGKITFEYLKQDSKDTDPPHKVNYNFEVERVDVSVEAAEISGSCSLTSNIETVVKNEENSIDCEKKCTNSNLESMIKPKCLDTSHCASNQLTGNACSPKINQACSKEERDKCILECNKNTKNNSSVTTTSTSSTCTDNKNLAVTLYDIGTVKPFNVKLVETYVLTPPRVYLDNSGKIVTPKESDINKYIDGGYKFYIDNAKVGNNYHISTTIEGLGLNKNTKIENNNCNFEVVQQDREAYRIIDVDNPFVNNARLDNLNNNWKNKIFDFTKITNSNSGNLYTFNISKEQINSIKSDNSLNSNSYLGTCSSKNISGIMEGICKEINSK